MRRRVIIRLELTPQAKKALEDVCNNNGMTQVSVSSRLVEWFAQQQNMLQAAILGHYPKDIERDIAELILKRMATAKPVAQPPEDVSTGQS
jgi:ubiquinone biosynthesis protein COQ9